MLLLDFYFIFVRHWKWWSKCHFVYIGCILPTTDTLIYNSKQTLVSEVSRYIVQLVEINGHLPTNQTREFSVTAV